VRHLAIHLLARLADGAHDETVGEEAIGDLDGLVEEAAGVVPDVDDHALDATGLLGLPLDVFEPLEHLGVGD